MTKQFGGLAALLAVMLVTCCAFAQSPRKPGGNHRGGRSAGVTKRLDRLSRRVNLTDDQKAKIKPILEARSDQLHFLKKNNSMLDVNKKASSQDIRQNAFRQVRSVLNPDQQNKLGGRSARADKQLAGLSRDLHLTDIQKTSIRPILEHQSKQVQALKKANKSMTKVDREAASRNIRRDAFRHIRSILPTEQQHKLDQLMEGQQYCNALRLCNGQG
jgi:Spy/CpxP family protein refolding chaperone